ncbi:MAG: UDP-glucose 4-epimerase [Thermoprotei archaeon]|nr:MAG: UDP-glucose 4-epimerase [Thermoprotei archaeon]
MKVLVTGGAGFMGSHLVDFLASQGFFIRVIDNLSSGRTEFIKHHMGKEYFEFIYGDLKDFDTTLKAMEDIDVVFHFAANPDVRISVREPKTHFDDNILATFNVLEAARRSGSVKKIIFASSSTVYGDAKVIPTPETHEMLPISVYGATKAAGEMLLCSYAYLYGFKGISLRYANIIGSRLRHGVIYDFIRHLQRDPTKLPVLGDGTQRKSYLYINDAIEAAIFLMNRVQNFFEAYNVGNEDWVTVREIAEIVIEEMGISAKIVYRGGLSDGRGWPGDVKYMRLDISKLKLLGWRPRMSSKEAVRATTRALIEELSAES